MSLESTEKARIDGVGPYTGGIFEFRFNIPARYPYDPPGVSQNGLPCDILSANYC